MENVIRSIFDAKFERYITPAIAGILMYATYAIVTVMWLIMMFQGGFSNTIMALIGIPVSLVFIRIWFEGLVALVKTAEASTKLVKLIEEQSKGNQS